MKSKVGKKRATFAGIALAAIAWLAICQNAHAVLIGPGTGATALPGLGSVAGDTLVGTLPGAFSNSGIAGTTETKVYLNSDGIHYDFTYQVTSVTKGTLERVTGFNFTGFTTDVDYIAGSGVTPTSGDRPAADGNTVGWSIHIPTSSSSVVLLIKTNATSFDALGNMAEIDGISTNTPAFEPVASSVPEPASAVLLGTCLFGLGGAAAWRRRKAEAVA